MRVGFSFKYKNLHLHNRSISDTNITSGQMQIGGVLRTVLLEPTKNFQNKDLQNSAEAANNDKTNTALLRCCKEWKVTCNSHRAMFIQYKLTNAGACLRPHSNQNLGMGMLETVIFLPSVSFLERLPFTSPQDRKLWKSPQ